MSSAARNPTWQCCSCACVFTRTPEPALGAHVHGNFSRFAKARNEKIKVNKMNDKPHSCGAGCVSTGGGKSGVAFLADLYSDPDPNPDLLGLSATLESGFRLVHVRVAPGPGFF